jgi:hypothetical protein
VIEELLLQPACRAATDPGKKPGGDIDRTQLLQQLTGPANGQEMRTGQQRSAGKGFPGRSAPAIPARPRSLCARPVPPDRPSPGSSPPCNTDTPSRSADTRSPSAAAPAGYQRSDAADGYVRPPRAVRYHRTRSDPGESPASRWDRRSDSARPRPNPAACPACAPTWYATSVSSPAASTTARPTTEAATNSRNPCPTAVPTPRSARPARRSHDPVQPAPFPTRPHARAPAQTTPQPTPEPTPQDHLSPSTHHAHQGARQLNSYC